MKNIILQHWDGDISQLAQKSIDSFKKYAKLVNSEYQLIRGKPVHSEVSPQMQKLHMLNEVFDEYDYVVMVDCDMFVKKNMNENIFEVSGIGMNTFYQKNLHLTFCKRFPKYGNVNYPFWGGAIYKTDLNVRKTFRKHMNLEEMKLFSVQSYQDEATMHRLAVLSDYKDSNPYLPDEFKWCHCSYRKGIEKSSFIHVRTKIHDNKNSPKRTKWENYSELVKKGLIE